MGASPCNMKPRPRRTILFALVWVLLTLYGCRGGNGGRTDGSGLMALYDKAEDLRAEGRYDNAAKLFMDAGALYSPSLPPRQPLLQGEPRQGRARRLQYCRGDGDIYIDAIDPEYIMVLGQYSGWTVPGGIKGQDEVT